MAEDTAPEHGDTRSMPSFQPISPSQTSNAVTGFALWSVVLHVNDGIKTNMLSYLVEESHNMRELNLQHFSPCIKEMLQFPSKDRYAMSLLSNAVFFDEEKTKINGSYMHEYD